MLQKFGLSSIADRHIAGFALSLNEYRVAVPARRSLLRKNGFGCNLNWNDSRVLVFGRLCGMFDDEPTDTQDTTAMARNGTICYVQILCKLLTLLLLSDAKKMKAEPTDLLQVYISVADESGQLDIPRGGAATVCSSVLHFIDEQLQQQLNELIATSAPPALTQDMRLIDFDHLMSLCMSIWCEHDKQLNQQVTHVYRAHAFTVDDVGTSSTTTTTTTDKY